MPLNEIRSEGLRQWNMDMDVEYQYETFNGLPVYYSGDMYDAEDPEEYDPFEIALAAYVEDYNFDVPEGMELMTYTRHRPDGGNRHLSQPTFYGEVAAEIMHSHCNIPIC